MWWILGDLKLKFEHKWSHSSNHFSQSEKSFAVGDQMHQDLGSNVFFIQGGYDHWMKWNVLPGGMMCQMRRKKSRRRWCVEIGHLRSVNLSTFLFIRWSLLKTPMCSVQWMKRVRKGFWSCQVQQKCWRGAKLIWAVKGENFMHCWPSSNVASDLMISPFKSLFLFRNHICRSIWFGSLRVSDHIKSVYYTGREAEVGWGRRARWRAKKWWWRTCSMLLL